MRHHAVLKQFFKHLDQGNHPIGDSGLPLPLVHENQESVLRSLEKEHESELIEQARNELSCWGPIQDLIANPSVKEIIINSPKDIYYESETELKKHPKSFFSEITFANLLHRICEQSGIQLTRFSPMSSGAFQDFRVQLTGPPITKSKTVTLRRKNTTPLALKHLIEWGWCKPEQARQLEELVGDRKNLLVVGETGSGKTTLLNTLLSKAAATDRCVIIEDTDEIIRPNNASVKLLTYMNCQHPQQEMDQGELLRHSLRLRPDRIIVGEVRGAEAKHLLLATSTGHRGTLCTLHAESAKQALWRLEMLVQMGSPQWRSETVRQMILLGLDVIIVVGKVNGQRQLKGLFELCSVEASGITLNNISACP